MSLGVAIIGSGIFAREEHLPAIQQTPQLTLRAIYSRSLASAKTLGSGIPDVDLYSEDAGAGKTFKDLLERSDVQAVVIALPITVQPAFVKAALSAGKHVLSEKPVAADMAGAKELIQWYRENAEEVKATWAVAENYRFLDQLLYAREMVQKLGRVLGVRVVRHSMVQVGGRYFGLESPSSRMVRPDQLDSLLTQLLDATAETSWRKTPSYQGGFLLDGGVHFVAAARLLLGESDSISRVSAQTSQLQPHLPPVDTLEAVLKTKSGVTGSFSVSFGTTFTASEYAIACERGTVTVLRNKVVAVVQQGDATTAEETVKEFQPDDMGVKVEVRAWAEGILTGTLDPRQSPEEAMRDLEILEKMLRSGESGGIPLDIDGN